MLPESFVQPLCNHTSGAVWLPSGRGSSAGTWRARHARRENWPERVWTSPWEWDGRTANRLVHSNRSGGFQPGNEIQANHKYPFFNGLCSVLGLQEKWYTLHQQGGRRHEMSSMWSRTTIQRAVAVTCGLLIGFPAIFAQTPGDQTMGTPDT